MQEYGPDLPTKEAEVWCVTIVLEETAVEWMVTFHNDEALELQSFDPFMLALQKRFEEAFTDCKTRT